MSKLKPNVTRVNILMPTDEYQVFKLIVGKHRAFDEDKNTMRTATVSDVIREFILEYIGEQKEHIPELIAEVEKHAPNSSILKTLKEFNGE